MLHACAINFGGHWDQFFPLVELAYNSIYYSRVYISQYEAIYRMRYKSLIGWFNAFEVRPWITNLLKKSLEKMKFIYEKILVAHNRKKVYVGKKVRDTELMMYRSNYRN